jgi:hypothetical protein
LDNMVTMKENSVRHVHSGEIEVIYKWIEKLTKITNNTHTLKKNIK